MENANNLQNIEKDESNFSNEVLKEEITNQSNQEPNFEVDSIELANPELFSQDEESNVNQNNNSDSNEMKKFEDSTIDKNSLGLENSTKTEDSKIDTKEPEMFSESELEEDFEIPAFLRRQKN